ncbi:MAG: class I SAM-dependent methyltransferase [Candidatus Woesearchaeota archaeon]|nr:class I SAM-dependent methyltransferase [Candidatus Woesearchaeota archaeon]
MSEESILNETIDVYNDSAAVFAETTNKFDLTPLWDSFISYLPGNRIIDLGCGAGRDVRHFVERGFSVTGVDLSEELLNYAKRLCSKASFVNADIRHLSFSNTSFDGVWCCGGIVHMGKTEGVKTLQEAHRILVSGGVFFLSFKEGTGEIYQESKTIPGIKKRYVLYAEDEMKQLLTNTGFTLLSITRSEKPWVNVFCQK